MCSLIVSFSVKFYSSILEVNFLSVGFVAWASGSNPESLAHSVGSAISKVVLVIRGLRPLLFSFHFFHLQSLFRLFCFVYVWFQSVFSVCFFLEFIYNLCSNYIVPFLVPVCFFCQICQTNATNLLYNITNANQSIHFHLGLIDGTCHYFLKGVFGSFKQSPAFFKGLSDEPLFVVQSSGQSSGHLF